MDSQDPFKCTEMKSLAAISSDFLKKRVHRFGHHVVIRVGHLVVKASDIGEDLA